MPIFAEIGGAEVGVVLTGVGSRQAELAISKVRGASQTRCSFASPQGLLAG